MLDGSLSTSPARLTTKYPCTVYVCKQYQDCSSRSPGGQELLVLWADEICDFGPKQRLFYLFFAVYRDTVPLISNY